MELLDNNFINKSILFLDQWRFYSIPISKCVGKIGTLVMFFDKMGLTKIESSTHN